MARKLLTVFLAAVLGTYPLSGIASSGQSDCTIEGTGGRDRLIGTTGPDIICGFDGNDVLKGRGGNDILRGHHGDDRLLGGDGNDRLRGDKHNDDLVGGHGNDYLTPGGMSDNLNGGAGDDRIVGESRHDGDTLFFNPDGPRVRVDLRTESATGQGQDKIEGEFEEIYGTHSDDKIISGERNAPELFGMRGDDILRSSLSNGGRGDDELRGTRYPDLFWPGRGGDTIFGGKSEGFTFHASTDTLAFVLGPITIDVHPNDEVGDSDGVARGEGRDVFESIRSFHLTPGDDRFIGDSRRNNVLGEGGADFLEGGGHIDKLRGGTGSDTIRAQGGDDILDGGLGNTTDKMNGGPGDDQCREVQQRDKVKSCEEVVPPDD